MTIRQSAHPLLEADDSLLIVIDIQNHFLEKLPPTESERVVNRATWLIAVARWRSIPIVVTAEEIQKQPITSKIVQALPVGTPTFDKTTFGLAGQENILAAVKQTGRKTAVLIGLETDVCVAHSAIGLLDQGFRVAVVSDAVASPRNGHEVGLGRMHDAGVVIVSTKSLFYEWMRNLESVYRFHAECPNMRDVDDIIL